MFWKRSRRPFALATRLTAWYAVTVTVLLIIAIVVIDYMVTGDIDPSALRNIEKVFVRLHEGREAIIQLPPSSFDDEDNDLRIIDPEGRTRLETPRIALEIPREAFPPHGQHRERKLSGGRLYSLFTRVQDGWTYQLALNRTDERRVVNLIYRNFALVGIPTLLVAVTAGYLLAKAGLRPLRVVAKKMRSVSAERLESRVPVELFPVELADVASSFNQVMDRLTVSVSRLDQFAADVAHELRTPVHNLRTAAEIALRQERPAEEYRQILGGVVDEADRLSRLIDRLLLLARLANPRLGLALEEVNLANELDDVREFFEPACGEAEIELTVNVPPDLTHQFDLALLQRAVSNLVANALAHTPRGGKIDLSARRESNAVIIEVRDTGRGIPAEALPKLFDRYYRPVGAVGDGVGLGLAIVKRVVDLHGGLVSVESVLGEGTTMRLTFFNKIISDDTDVMKVTRG